MEAFQQRVLTERTVFLSYSHQDVAEAARLETELAARNVHVYRDVQSLYPGEPWQPALERAVRAADSFVVLISPEAGGSVWVKQEVAWALNEQRSGGLVAHIVPILLPAGGWEAFTELHHLHRVDHPAQPTPTRLLLVTAFLPICNKPEHHNKIYEPRDNFLSLVYHCFFREDVSS